MALQRRLARWQTLRVVGRQYLPLIFLILLCVFVFWSLPLGTAFQFGEDEGFELIKGFLCFKGYKLYTDIWNDQPPLSTVVLTAAFKLLSPSILTARLVACAFGLTLITAYYGIIRMRTGTTIALIASLLLLASPGILLLMSSCMLEVPAFATALVSVWLLFRWGKARQLAWLLASGAVMGMALQIKLTSALVLPASVIELYVLSAEHRGQRVSKYRFLRLVLWGLALLLMSIAIGFTWGRGSLASSWRSHTTSSVGTIYGLPQDYRFNPKLLLAHLECWIAALLCVAYAVRRGRIREIAFPALLLATMGAVHSVHRPWWNYYYLHFAIPIAWLAGWSITSLYRNLLDSLQIPKAFSARGARSLLCLLAVGFVVARSERRIEGDIRELRHRAPAADNAIVRQLRLHGGPTIQAYSESGIYPFHANIPVLPQLAIIMPKRFWSHQISTGEIVATCAQYQPAFIVLPVTTDLKEWQPLLKETYKYSTTDGLCNLYVRQLK